MFDPIRGGKTSPVLRAVPPGTHGHPGAGDPVTAPAAPAPNPLLDPLRTPPVDDDPLRPHASIFLTPFGQELIARTPAVASGPIAGDQAPSSAAPLSGPLADPLATSADEDDPLRPRASVFVTPLGRELMARIPVGPAAGSALAAVTELKTAADTRRHIALAAERIARGPAPGVLVLGGGHHIPSSLSMFHAAIDAWDRHGLVLCLEHGPRLFGQLDHLVRFLQHEPALKKMLGSNPLHSRGGQAIAWDYVRASEDRGALQRFLPEILAWNEIRHRGVEVAFVDPLGLEGGTDEVREAIMSTRTRETLGDERRGVLLGGLMHSTRILANCLLMGLNAESLVVFDDTADNLHRIFDAKDSPIGQTTEAAHVFRHELSLPQNAQAASRTRSYRVRSDVHPFS